MLPDSDRSPLWFFREIVFDDVSLKRSLFSSSNWPVISASVRGSIPCWKETSPLRVRLAQPQFSDVESLAALG